MVQWYTYLLVSSPGITRVLPILYLRNVSVALADIAVTIYHYIIPLHRNNTMGNKTLENKVKDT